MGKVSDIHRKSLSTDHKFLSSLFRLHLKCDFNPAPLSLDIDIFQKRYANSVRLGLCVILQFCINACSRIRFANFWLWFCAGGKHCRLCTGTLIWWDITRGAFAFSFHVAFIHVFSAKFHFCSRAARECLYYCAFRPSLCMFFLCSFWKKATDERIKNP